MGAFERFYCNLQYIDKNILIDGHLGDNLAKDKYTGVKNGKRWRVINFNNTATKNVIDFQNDPNIESTLFYDSYYFSRDTLTIDTTLGTGGLVTLQYVPDAPATLCDVIILPPVTCCDTCDLYIDSRYNQGDNSNTIPSFNSAMSSGQLWFIDLVNSTLRTPCFDDGANGQDTNNNHLTGGIDIFFNDGSSILNVHVLDFAKDPNDLSSIWLMGGRRIGHNFNYFLSPLECLLKFKNGVPPNNTSLKNIDFLLMDTASGTQPVVTNGLTVRIESIRAKCGGQTIDIDVIIRNVATGAVFQTDTNHLKNQITATKGRLVTFCAQ